MARTDSLPRYEDLLQDFQYIPAEQIDNNNLFANSTCNYINSLESLLENNSDKQLLFEIIKRKVKEIINLFY